MIVTVTITSMINFMNGIHVINIKKDRKIITNNGIRISGRQLGKKMVLFINSHDKTEIKKKDMMTYAYNQNTEKAEKH